MKEIGFHATPSGQIGGKERGLHFRHYPIRRSAFGVAFETLEESGWKLDVESARQARRRGPNSKIKFSCPQCGQTAWGKLSLSISCTPCVLEMSPASSSYLESSTCSTIPQAAAVIG